mgnify:CR=1 FL=1
MVGEPCGESNGGISRAVARETPVAENPRRTEGAAPVTASQASADTRDRKQAGQFPSRMVPASHPRAAMVHARPPQARARPAVAVRHRVDETPWRSAILPCPRSAHA